MGKIILVWTYSYNIAYIIYYEQWKQTKVCYGVIKADIPSVNIF